VSTERCINEYFRRIRGDMIELFKILTGKYDPEVSNFIQLKRESSSRGHNYKIFKIRHRLNIRKYSFIHRSVDTWNNLPDLNRGHVRLGSSECTHCNYSTVADLFTVCLIWIQMSLYSWLSLLNQVNYSRCREEPQKNYQECQI
jgi:ribosomal protein L33